MGFLSTIGRIAGTVFGGPQVGEAIGGFLDDNSSAGLSFIGGERQNSANAAEAERNRQFQANQTGSSYQRAVADLKAAGLNPMLAYPNGGAASAAGSMAQMGNSIGNAVSTSMQRYKNDAEVELLKTQLDKTATDTFTSHWQGVAQRKLGDLYDAQKTLTKNSASKVAQDAYIDSLTIPGLENIAGVEKSSAGSAAAWIKKGAETIGAAKGAAGKSSIPHVVPRGSVNTRTGEIY